MLAGQADHFGKIISSFAVPPVLPRMIVMVFPSADRSRRQLQPGSAPICRFRSPFWLLMCIMGDALSAGRGEPALRRFIRMYSSDTAPSRHLAAVTIFAFPGMLSPHMPLHYTWP